MDRRTLLRAIAAAVLMGSTQPQLAQADPGRRRSRQDQPSDAPRVVNLLPGDANQLALTVDDGTNSEVVAAFAQFCRDTGVRLTFFPNGVNPAWTINAPLLRPMVDSGQIQLGNHTWSHPRLTDISPAAAADQIRRNADFLRRTYGVDGTPYFRPPYGLHNPDIDRAASDLGYNAIALWSTTIGDSRPENAQQIVTLAEKNFRPQQIVLAHANLTPITHTYQQLLDIIVSRGLQTVTLADVFG